MKSKIINISIILLSILGLLLYINYTEGLKVLLTTLKSLKILWISCALALMVIYWLLEATALHLIVVESKEKHSFLSTLKTSMIGQFFNCVTPFASGGQPIQAYHLVKSDVPMSTALSSLLSKFIVYQVGLTLYSLIILLFKFTFFENAIPKFSYLVFLGFIVNLLVVIFLMSVGYYPNISIKITTFTINILNKVHIIKNPTESIEKSTNEIIQFRDSFQNLKTNKKLLFKISAVTMIQLTTYFTIPYFIYLSLGLKGSSIWSIIAAQAFVLMITSFVPLPGAAGGAEGSFYIFFQLFFPVSTLGVAILLWRMITFYLCLLIGGLFSFFGLSKKDKLIGISS